MAEPAGKRPGRRPGETRTRRAILDAARARFAAHGFEKSTVRAIAADADVDPALVLHFFGSKRVLFAAAMTWPFETEGAVERVLTGPRSKLGHRLAAFFVSVWEDPDRREPIIGMIRASTTDPHAAELLRETLKTVIIGPLAARLDKPDADLRMSLCSAHLIGVGVYRYVLHTEPLASLPPERLVELVGPALQRYMTASI